MPGCLNCAVRSSVRCQNEGAGLGVVHSRPSARLLVRIALRHRFRRWYNGEITRPLTNVEGSADCDARSVVLRGTSLRRSSAAALEQPAQSLPAAHFGKWHDLLTDGPNPPKVHEATFEPLPVTPTAAPAAKPAKPPKLTKAQRYVLDTEERVQQLIEERGIVEYLSTLCDPSDPELRALRRIAERKGTPSNVHEEITRFIWLMTTHERQR